MTPLSRPFIPFLLFLKLTSHWSTVFHVNLVYSCAYKNLSNQGWLYLSLSHICFHSFVFGVEIKLQLNIKDILVLSREKSKAGMVDDSIRIVDTANKEYVFSNLFHRDETFDLIEYMTNLAMRKLLKSTCTDPAPGLSYQLEAKKFLVETSTDKPIKSAKPLLEILDHQKRNHAVNITFNIPETEVLLNEISAICSISGTQSVFQGTSFLTSHFFCFISTVEIQCCMVIPLFTIKRVEKITNQNAISITLYHQLKIIVQFTSDKPSSDSFCMSLKDLLKKHLELMKRVKDFVSSCASEDILIDKPVLNGGLGIKFDFIEKHTQKDVQKIKYWINYMKDYGRNMTIVRLGTFIKLVRIGIPPTLRGEIWEVCCGSIYKRYLNPGHYQKLLDDNVGKTSLSTEEIEKDLNRSLPEYAGYQTEEGISTLRRVLYAFSFHDPEIGYCQAMNLVVSLFLIYLSEEQAFWILTVLCERLVNGYYSVNMVGAVVDNHVFDTMVFFNNLGG